MHITNVTMDIKLPFVQNSSQKIMNNILMIRKIGNANPDNEVNGMSPLGAANEL